MKQKIFEYIGKFNEKKHKLMTSSNTNSSSTSTRIQNILTSKTPFTITEAYKTSRTNLLFALAGVDGCKKVIFTSAEPGEGKTTSIINLSITFAQTDARVLLIDGDLRKPRLHRYMNVEKKDGLSDILAGLLEVEKAIHHTDLNFDFISAGQIPPNPVELLSSGAMEKLLVKLSENYDYIFMDTPPVTVVTDAASMAKFVDGYVIVVRHNYTIHELLEKARASLLFAEAKILGYIINDIKPMGGLGYGKYGAYGGKYKYRYKYRYGYKYGNKYGYNDYGYGYGYGYQYKDRKDNAYSDEYVYGDEVETEHMQPKE